MTITETLRALIEEQLKVREVIVNGLMDEMDVLTDLLETLYEEHDVVKTKQELLENELEELIDECKTASFYREDDVTIAVITLDGKLMPEVGVAKCCYTDEFDVLTGEVVALKKALGLPINSKQYGELKDAYKDALEEEEHDCYNCKYESLGILDYPCNKCCNDSIEGDELFPCWKSIDEEDVAKYGGLLDSEHDCDTCKHDATKSVHDEPCNTCLTSPTNTPICWEPIEKKPDYTKMDRYGVCIACKNRGVLFTEQPCIDCTHLLGGSIDSWEPQEGK